MRWWPWRRQHQAPTNGDAAKAEAEATLRVAKRTTQHVQKMAPAMANLPPEEFAQRVARAFRGWA